MKNLKAHALITARGGSKGLKNKNLKRLNGLSLVEIAIRNAKSSGIFEKIFCSSDSKKILNRIKNKSICIVRPEKYAKDNSTSESVVNHYLKFLDKEKINIPQILFLFQPTSPFIKTETIRKMFEIYKKDKKVGSVVSVYKVNNKYNYLNQRKIEDNSDMKFLFQRKKNNVRRQDKPEVYVHGNLYSINIKSFQKKNSFFIKPIKTVEIKTFKESIDIDDKNDYDLAKKLIS